MKKVLSFLFLSVALLSCQGNRDSTGLPSVIVGSDGLEETASFSGEETISSEEQEVSMKLRLEDTEVNVRWEDNASVRALQDMVRTSPIRIPMSGYGGFEQVGELPQSLPSSDTRITTQPGDIVLYTSNHICVYYDTNTWSFTRLGKIIDKTALELRELLGGRDVLLTLSM